MQRRAPDPGRVQRKVSLLPIFTGSSNTRFLTQRHAMYLLYPSVAAAVSSCFFDGAWHARRLPAGGKKSHPDDLATKAGMSPSFAGPAMGPDPFALESLPDESYLQVLREWADQFRPPVSASSNSLGSSALHSLMTNTSGDSMDPFASLGSLRQQNVLTVFSELATTSPNLPSNMALGAARRRSVPNAPAILSSASLSLPREATPMEVLFRLPVENPPAVYAVGRTASSNSGPSGSLETGNERTGDQLMAAKINLENDMEMDNGNQRSVRDQTRRRGRGKNKETVRARETPSRSRRKTTPEPTPSSSTTPSTSASSSNQLITAAITTTTDSIPPKVLTDIADTLFGKHVSDLAPDELRACIDNIMSRRSRNTESARRSRVRKQEQLQSLDDRIEELEQENEALRDRVAKLEERIREMGESP